MTRAGVKRAVVIGFATGRRTSGAGKRIVFPTSEFWYTTRLLITVLLMLTMFVSRTSASVGNRKAMCKARSDHPATLPASAM